MAPGHDHSFRTSSDAKEPGVQDAEIGTGVLDQALQKQALRPNENAVHGFGVAFPFFQLRFTDSFNILLQGEELDQFTIALHNTDYVTRVITNVKPYKSQKQQGPTCGPRTEPEMYLKRYEGFL